MGKSSKKETYAWKFLIYHLRAAGQDGEADRLLTNYAWIKAKLHVSGAGSLFGSYLPESENANVRLVGHAIALSVPALAADPSEFARQIYGRLGHFKSGIAAVLAAVGCKDAQFCPAPRWPMLTPPGPERLRLMGHNGIVTSASFAFDGHRLVTASDDGTARLWDAKSGEEIARITLDAGIDALAVSRIAIALGDRLGRIHVFDADPYLNDKEPRRA